MIDRPTIFQSPHAIMIMAQLLAGKEVKRELRDRGIKVHQVAVSEIKARAKDYLFGHPEIVAQAKVICEELHQRALVKRERQRWRRQQARSNIRSAA
jgi:hypothetical protein